MMLRSFIAFVIVIISIRIPAVSALTVFNSKSFDAFTSFQSGA